MEFVVFSFVAVFLLVASGGLLLFYREATVQRLSAVITPRRRRTGWASAILQGRSSLTGVVERFERVLPKSQAEVSVNQQRMIRAGYRNDAAVKLLYGAKVLLPLVLCAVVALTGLSRLSPLLAYGLALALGFLAPDYWLGNRIAARQSRIRRGLPDMLDLLVICVEAGLSLDQATARTAEELRLAHPAINDELGMVVLEQHAGRARADAWQHFSERTGVDSVRNLVSVLVQSEKFGTSVGKTLRVHAETLRTQRRQQVEEQAAKTTVKLVFPLALFIFPSLFLVTLGPAMILITETFHAYLTH